MDKTGKGELRAPGAAPGRFGSLDDTDPQTGLRQENGCRQPVRSGTNNDCVVGVRQFV